MTSFLSTNESQIGQNDLLSTVLRFFISANIPFNVADNPYFQELIQTAQRLQSQVSYSHLLVLIQLSPSVPSIHFNGFTVHAFDFLSKMSPLLTSRTSEQRSALARSARLAERARVNSFLRAASSGWSSLARLVKSCSSLGSLGSLPSLSLTEEKTRN